jgi:hypothetical protein
MPELQKRTFWSGRNPFPLFGDWRADVRVHYRIDRQPDAFNDDELMELERIWKEGLPPNELDRTLRRKLYRVQSGRRWHE